MSTLYPYERSTDELRQVVRVNGGSSTGVVDQQVCKVQRKWLVKDGEGRPIPWGEHAPTGWVCVAEGPDGYYPQYAPTRTEWRDLPMVTEEEARQ